MAAIGSGVLMSTIDGSIVNIALNTLVNDFNSNLNVVEWVMLAYLLTLTCLLLLAGRVGDMFGKRRVYIIGFVVFTVASALCGLSPTIGALIGFRVVQAIGAAMIQAIGPALLVVAFPPNERGTALGVIGSVVAAGILIGPALGGLLLNYVSWQSIFYVNIPIGLGGIWLSQASLPADQASAQKHRFDVIGAAFMLVSLFCLLFGLTEGPLVGWGNPWIIGLFASAITVGGLFIWWERRTAQPMLNLNIFRQAAFSLNLLAGFILFCSISFNLLMAPLLLQLVYELDLQTTGFVLISLPITLSLVSPISGRLSDRIGARLLTISGLVTIMLSFIAMSIILNGAPLIYMIGALLLLGAGIGLFQSPNNSVIMGNAPAEALGVAGALLAVMRTLGQTGGIAIAGAILTSRVETIAGEHIEPLTAAPPDILSAGFSQTFLIAAIIALLAIAPSLAGGRAGARARAAEPNPRNA